MLYRSLMTSTVWAPTLDELLVCVYVRFVCERGRVFCLCARATACVHACELLCECACCTLILMAVECDCRRWSFVYCLVMDGFPVSDRPPFRRPSLWVSLCCTGPARKGGRAPFLSVSHWYSSLKWSVGHFCFIRSWNGREGGTKVRGEQLPIIFAPFLRCAVKSMQLFAWGKCIPVETKPPSFSSYSISTCINFLSLVVK